MKEKQKKKKYQIKILLLIESILLIIGISFTMISNILDNESIFHKLCGVTSGLILFIFITTCVFYIDIRSPEEVKVPIDKKKNLTKNIIVATLVFSGFGLMIITVYLNIFIEDHPTIA
ncbi:MAG: hypothetical protein ACFFBF_17460, partial [Promethearchaeota archaeon]